MSCAALFCTSKRRIPTPGITYHRFPGSRKLRKKWLVNIGRKKWSPLQSSLLCSLHFEAHCFDKTGMTTRLREGSIPTLFEKKRVTDGKRRFYKRNLVSDDDGDSSDSREDEEVCSKPSSKGEGPKGKLLVHFTSQQLKEFLDKGQMEKLPNGSYHIKMDALNALKASSPTKIAHGSSLCSKFSLSRNGSLGKKCQSKYFPDSLCDFNSSEDEEESPFAAVRDSLHGMFPPTVSQPGRHSASYLDELHQMFIDKVVDGCNSDESGISEDDITDLDSIPTGRNFCPGSSCVEAYLGVNKKTKVQIQRAGTVKELNNELYEEYNIVTITGKSSTTKPLLVPFNKDSLKVKNFEVKKESDKKNLAEPQTLTFEQDDPELVDELEKKRLSVRKYKHQLRMLRRRYIQLLQKQGVDSRCTTMGDFIKALSNFLTEDQLLFLSVQLKSGCKANRSQRFSVREKMLALGIYQQKPDVYDWLCYMFNLPKKDVLEKWLDTVARSDQDKVKRIMYNVLTTYNFKAKE